MQQEDNIQSVEDILKDMGYKRSADPIKPGDLYIARRNRTVLLECKEIKNGMVCPTNMDYPYDLHECCKIIPIDSHV